MAEHLDPKLATHPALLELLMKELLLLTEFVVVVRGGKSSSCCGCSSSNSSGRSNGGTVVLVVEVVVVVVIITINNTTTTNNNNNSHLLSSGVRYTLRVVRGLDLTLISCDTVRCCCTVAAELAYFLHGSFGGRVCWLSWLSGRAGRWCEAVETRDAHGRLDKLFDIHRAQAGHRIPARCRIEAFLAAGVIIV